MRPGDTESHRHPPQPARTPRCSPAPAGPGAVRPIAAPPLVPRPRHPPSRRTSAVPPRDLGQFPFARNGNCPRSAGSHRPDRGIRCRIAPSAPGGHPAARHPLSAARHPPPADTQRRSIREQRPVASDMCQPHGNGNAAGRHPVLRVPASGPCRAVVRVPVVVLPRVSCSSAGRRGRWPAAPTGRRRPGKPTPAPSAPRRSAACPANHQPASDPSRTRWWSTQG